LPYKRVLLKFSGEALAGEKRFGISHLVIDQISDEIIQAKALGTEIGIVIGGGNFFRGIEAGEGGDRVKADQMGMLATVMNALAMQEMLQRKGQTVHHLSAIRMIEVAEPMIAARANEYLSDGKIVLFSAGTGNPFFSTDTAAALRAAEIKADAIIKATKVDGVYDKDPVKYPDALFFRDLNFQEVVEKQLKVMDLTAITLCRDNRIPIIVYNMKKPGNLDRILRGEKIGTLISGGQNG